jgi:hypothetical protein
MLVKHYILCVNSASAQDSWLAIGISSQRNSLIGIINIILILVTRYNFCNKNIRRRCMYNMWSNLQKTELQQLVHDCYEQKDMNKKIEILYKINSMLPESLHMKKIPSLLTDDYIDNLLYKIEQNLLLASNNMV